MSGFNRYLPDDFMAALQTEPLVRFYRDCAAGDPDGLDLRLRECYLSAYYGAASLARLRWVRGCAYLEVHRRYVEGTPLAARSKCGNRSYAAVQVDGAVVDLWGEWLSTIRRQATKVNPAPEGRWEHNIVKANLSAPLVVMDRQVQLPSRREDRLDVLAVLPSLGGTCLAAVEIKRDLDNRIQTLPAKVLRYVEMLQQEQGGLREDVASGYRKAAAQMQQLGLAGPNPGDLQAGNRVVGVVVLGNYNSKSDLLRRAHAAARGISAPIYLVQLQRGEHLIPNPATWALLGD